MVSYNKKFTPTKRPKNKCKSCGYTWYPRGSDLSRKCPSCGGNNVSKAGLGVVGSVLFLMLLAIANSGHKDSPPTPVVTPTQPETVPNTLAVARKKQSVPNAQNIYVGDVLNSGSFQIQVKSAIARSSVGSSFNFIQPQAPSGEEYIAVSWTYKNVSQYAIKSVNVPNITLIDSSGKLYKPDTEASNAYASEVGAYVDIPNEVNPRVQILHADVFKLSQQDLAPGGWRLLIKSIDGDIDVLFSPQTDPASASSRTIISAPTPVSAPTTSDNELSTIKIYPKGIYL